MTCSHTAREKGAAVRGGECPICLSSAVAHFSQALTICQQRIGELYGEIATLKRSIESWCPHWREKPIVSKPPASG